MPIPPALAAAIESRLTATYNPAAERAEFRQWSPDWRLYIDLYELDRHKLKTLVEKHGPNENPAKFAARQTMAAVVNLVPSLVDMVRDYLFSEEPRIETGGDKDLEAFVADCDGRGTPLVQWLRLKTLPLSLVCGMVDAVVSNPATDDDTAPQTAADKEAAGLRPAVAAYTPLERINWATNRRGEYQWVTYRDRGNEKPDPLKDNNDPTAGEGYITLSAHNADYAEPGKREGFWIRFWRNDLPAGAATPMGQPDAPTAPKWAFDAGYSPAAAVPVATLFYKESIDPNRPRFGVSKIAVIAILTNKIVQLLSWMDEDLIASLALLALPTKDGKPPKNRDGTDAITSFEAASILYYPEAAHHGPGVVQGDVAHIRVKLEIVREYVTEILRLAHLIGASGDATVTKSGIHAVVQRTELFQELGDVAVGLDSFVLDLLALAKSWAAGKQVTRDDLTAAGVAVSFHKGPYAVDPLAVVLQNVKVVQEMFTRISPTLVRRALEQVARAAVYADDPELPTIIKEIRAETPKVLEEDSAAAAALAAIAAGATTPAGVDAGVTSAPLNVSEVA